MENFDNVENEVIEQVESTETKKGSNDYTVTATNGKQYTFNKRVTLHKETEVLEDGSIKVTLVAKDGTVNESILNPSTVLQLAQFGAMAKLANCFHVEEDIEDAFTSVDELVAQLNAGNWTRERTKGEGKGGSMIVRAIVEVMGVPKQAAIDYLANLTMAQKFALAQTDELRPVVERLKAEKAAKKASGKNAVDTGSLLLGLAALR